MGEDLTPGQKSDTIGRVLSFNNVLFDLVNVVARIRQN